MKILAISEARAGMGGALAAARRLASVVGDSAAIHALVFGETEAAQAEAQTLAAAAGVYQVQVAAADGATMLLAENAAPVIAQAAAGFDYVLMNAGTTARAVLPRAAAALDSQMLSDVLAIEEADVFVRPTYAGNALTTVRLNEKIKIFSVRGAAFDEDAPAREGAPAEIKTLDAPESSPLTAHVEDRASESARPDLTAARIIVSGGRGMGGAEAFAELEKLADKLGAAVGASRAAVDAGYVSNDHQVGQTGKIVAPDLYIAVGISGAIQHLAGMKDAKVIVAINKDGDAPIFEVADYGLVGDWRETLPQLRDAL